MFISIVLITFLYVQVSRQLQLEELTCVFSILKEKGSGAKAMVCEAHKTNTVRTYFLLTMSAVKSVNWKAVKNLIGYKVKLASAEKVTEITKCMPGAVPPFGSLWNIPTYMDSSLQEQGTFINFNSVKIISNFYRV